MCCFISGRSGYWHDELSTRFSLLTIPLACATPHDPSKIRPIAWPRTLGDPQAELKTLREILWGYISDPQVGQEAPESADDFRKRLVQPSWPHLFSSEIEPAAWSADQALLLSSWLSFWGELTPNVTNRTPVHFFVVKDAGAAEIREWLKRVPVPPAVALCILPELDFCFWQDIGEWVNQRIKLLRPEITDDFEQLKSELEEELQSALKGPNRFSIADLKDAVKRVTRRN
jgi:hypothetical protein